MGEIKLLDCTLRDGGYVNDWEFGYNNIVSIFERLVSARVDIIEVGFLDARRNFNINASIMPDTEAVNKIYGLLHKGESLIVGMIDYGTCGMENLVPCSQCYLDGIRVIFKKDKMHEAIAFCQKIKELGYKVFAQAVSITSYDGEELAELIGLVNELEPYTFSLVDTYGLLHKSQLMYYYTFATEHLKSNIGIGYHAHNNYQLAYANCIELLENAPQNRMLLVDGSLYGMGKSAGNAPTELLASYLNEHHGKSYSTSQLLEAIDVTILDIYRRTPWGYHLKFFLAATHDCHPNYVLYLLEKRKLSVKSVNEILGQIRDEKKLLYDREYIERLYVEYQKSISKVDGRDVQKLQNEIKGKRILLLGPGEHLEKEKNKVEEYLRHNAAVIISINCLPRQFKTDYVFVNNAKKYVQMSSALAQKGKSIRVIATSNITKHHGEFDYTVQYDRLLEDDALVVDNPLVMMIKLLGEFGVEEIALAGFDGYATSNVSDYNNPNVEHLHSKEHAAKLNEDTEKSIGRVKDRANVKFITSTFYRIEE